MDAGQALLQFVHVARVVSGLSEEALNGALVLLATPDCFRFLLAAPLRLEVCQDDQRCSCHQKDGEQGHQISEARLARDALPGARTEFHASVHCGGGAPGSAPAADAGGWTISTFAWRPLEISSTSAESNPMCTRRKLFRNVSPSATTSTSSPLVKKATLRPVLDDAYPKNWPGTWTGGGGGGSCGPIGRLCLSLAISAGVGAGGRATALKIFRCVPAYSSFLIFASRSQSKLRLLYTQGSEFRIRADNRRDARDLAAIEEIHGDEQRHERHQNVDFRVSRHFQVSKFENT